MRRPWLAFVFLFGLFCLTGPYDLNYRADKEVSATDLKTAVSGASAGIETGNPVRRFAVIGFAVFALVLTARTRSMARRGIPSPSGVSAGGGDRSMLIPIVMFLVVAAASALWAEDPGLVAKRIIVFLCLGAAAWAVARAWPLSDILLFTMLSCGAMLAGSLALEIVRGQFRPWNGEYRLMGLAHPNGNAALCAALILCALAAMRLTPRHRRAYVLVTIAAFGLLFLTRSRTSILALIATLFVVALRVMPKRRVFGVGLVLAAVALAIGVYGPGMIDSAKHALLLGRQESTADLGTLTGRTELWSELLTYSAARPLLGYGFDSFWSPMHTANVSLALGWVIPDAHSGYVEMLLDLGLIGLVLFVASLLSGLFHALRVLRADPGNSEALFSLAVLVWVLVAMFTEKIFPETEYAAFLTMIVLARQAAASPARVATPAPLPRVSVTATWRPST
jgi:exopolysaccharide production protein ExoQ